MKDEYETIPTRWVMKRKGESLFEENGFTIEIDDEASGGFIIVKDHLNDSSDGIQIDAEQWEYLRDAINNAVKACNQYNNETKNV
jgi:hypothetical protein